MANEAKTKIEFLKVLGPYFAALLAVIGVIVTAVIGSGEIKKTVSQLDNVVIPSLESKFNEQAIKIAKLEAYIDMMKSGMYTTMHGTVGIKPPAPAITPEKYVVPRMQIKGE